MNVIRAHPARGRKRHEDVAVRGELAHDLKTKRYSDLPPDPALVDIGPLVAVTTDGIGWPEVAAGSRERGLGDRVLYVRGHPRVAVMADGAGHDSLIHAVNGRGPLVLPSR